MGKAFEDSGLFLQVLGRVKELGLGARSQKEAARWSPMWAGLEAGKCLVVRRPVGLCKEYFVYFAGEYSWSMMTMADELKGAEKT